jgi:chemotaxis protein CheY-P-specific phosphatase CheC
MSTPIQEHFVKEVMQTGLARAANAFSKIIGHPVQVMHLQSILIDSREDIQLLYEEKGKLKVFVTQIIGEIFGRSYLIFSEPEADELIGLVKKKSVAFNEAFQDAFMLEVDNILSASVIAELSNALDTEVYGDVPAMKMIRGSELVDFLRNDIADENNFFILSKNTFEIPGNNNFKARFIWRISAKILESVQVHKIQK